MPPSTNGGPDKRSFRCTLCGECCRRYVPLVTAEDARRIQRSLSIPYERFLVLYQPDYFEPALEEDDDRVFVTREGRFVLGLARLEDGCVFLQGNLCSIHPSKPMVCRQYPFEPADPEDLEGSFQAVADPCWGLNAWDGVTNEADVRAAYGDYMEERRAYAELVQGWNDDPACISREPAQFLAHLGLLHPNTAALLERR